MSVALLSYARLRPVAYFLASLLANTILLPLYSNIYSFLNDRFIVGIVSCAIFCATLQQPRYYNSVFCCRMEILNLPYYCCYIVTYICTI